MAVEIEAAWRLRLTFGPLVLPQTRSVCSTPVSFAGTVWWHIVTSNPRATWGVRAATRTAKARSWRMGRASCAGLNTVRRRTSREKHLASGAHRPPLRAWRRGSPTSPCVRPTSTAPLRSTGGTPGSWSPTSAPRTGRRSYGSPSGPRTPISSSSSSRCPTAEGERPGVPHFGFSVASRADVDAIAAQARADGILREGPRDAQRSGRPRSPRARALRDTAPPTRSRSTPPPVCGRGRPHQVLRERLAGRGDALLDERFLVRPDTDLTCDLSHRCQSSPWLASTFAALTAFRCVGHYATTCGGQPLHPIYQPENTDDASGFAGMSFRF